MRIWEEFLRLDGWKSQFASVDRVLRHYARRVRSERTRENFCSTLMLFCKHCKMDPDTLASLSSHEVSKLCQDFTDSLGDRAFSVRYVNVSQAFLKTFFKENGFTGEKELKVERYHQPTRYRKKPEYVPTSEEIYRMGYAAGSAKNRAMIFTLYTSGVRNSTLRALLYRDAKDELNRHSDVVKIPVYPEMKQTDEGACKGNIPYYTFVSQEAIKALKEYLSERKQASEEIGDGELLFCSDSNQVSRQKQRLTPVSRNGLERMVKRAARLADVQPWQDVTPKSLRKAFESALRNNRLDPKDQEFLMGHILPGTQDPYYDSSKVEDLRTKYSKIEFFKTTQVDKLEMIKVFAHTLGIDKIEVKIQKLREKQRDMDEMEALGKIMRKELGMKPLETRMVKRRKEDEDCDNRKKYESKIVEEKDLLPHIDDGWEIVRELKSGKLAIRRELNGSQMTFVNQK
jgi:integrase